MAEKIAKTEAEWKKQLSDEQYHVTREAGAQGAVSGEYLGTKKPGGVSRVWFCPSQSCKGPPFPKGSLSQACTLRNDDSKKIATENSKGAPERAPVFYSTIVSPTTRWPWQPSPWAVPVCPGTAAGSVCLRCGPE